MGAKTERARIETLTIIDGVQWSMASVVLHLFHADPYPILDFRALWSVGLDVPTPYTFEFWWPYVKLCRAIFAERGVDMRTLDRALWQYSKENQRANDTRDDAEQSRGSAELGGGARSYSRGRFRTAADPARCGAQAWHCFLGVVRSTELSFRKLCGLSLPEMLVYLRREFGRREPITKAVILE